MMVGESAGIAAIQAINEGVAVQEIDIKGYLDKLNKVGQKLYWKKGNR